MSYKCQICDKEFATQRGLSGHQIAHKEGPRYRVSRKKTKIQIHNCQYCNVEFEHRHGTHNKFCSLQCFADHQWYVISVPNILAGKGGNFRRYLVETSGNVCAECGQPPVWNGKTLTLQLDHIDGDSDNNAIENLRLLCPNCHTQTPTYGNAGKGSRYKKNTKRNQYLQEYKNGRVAQR